MHPRLALAVLLAVAAPLAAPAPVLAQAVSARDNIDALIEQQAKAHKVPSAFVHKVVKRESNYNPRAKGGSALGLMQIKHATARGLGYTGDAAGLYDPETNLKYGVAYLAAAYRTAKGDLDQAYRYYNRGFYYAAKKLGIETAVPEDASAPAMLAGSATDFTKLFGLRTGAPGTPGTVVQTASADPNASVAGTPALAFAPGAQAALVEVPLPPRRPASLGGGEGAQAAPAIVETPAQPAVQAAVQAVAQPAPGANAAQAGGQAASDVVEVPLPPRRPADTVLAALDRPAKVARRPSKPSDRPSEPAPTLEAVALAPGQ